MRKIHLVPAVLSSVALLGLSAVLGQQDQKRDRPSVLDSKAVAVRLLLGVGDRGEQTWSGKVTVDKGEVTDVEGWRFRGDDRVTGAGSWQAKSHFTTAAKKAANKKGAAKNKKGAGKKAAAKAKAALAQGDVKKAPVPAGAGGNQATHPSGVIVTVKAPEDAKLTVTTDHGEFTVALADLTGGAPRRYLDERAEAQLVPPGIVLFDGDDQDDFPAASSDGKGTTWVAFVTHQARGPVLVQPLDERPKKFADYVPTGGGDQVRLIRYADGKADAPLDATEEGRDVWRPAVAAAGDGSVDVVWSENKGGNWDLYLRTYLPDEKKWSDTTRLTTDPGADTDVALAVDPQGKVWMAWQAWRNGQADILLSRLGQAENAQKVSDSPANEWSPALVFDKGGRAHVVFDSYAGGDYDVYLRVRGADGALAAPIAVADSPLFEARPSVAVDPSGRTWVAYEERNPNWGKDAENLVDGQGSTLYRSSAVRVRCIEGRRRLEPADPVAKAPTPLQVYNSMPRIACDRAGRVWLAFRNRFDARNNGVGGAWIGVAGVLAGADWSPLEVLARSDGALDNRAAFAVADDGAPLLFYSGDKRLSDDGNKVANGLNVAALSSFAPAPGGSPALKDAPATAAKTAGIHPDEQGDVARMRAHRIQAGGKTYQLVRGEFHRHTEISPDGGNDGALEDMWRYAIDCARLDWIGNGDHDNGSGKEYTWWLTQKTTDLYHSPSFTPMFTYERSVVFPHGHRNVMFAKRGIRTLPRLTGDVAGNVGADDTKMLYDHLKELGGICASHTSATSGMGTDWRDNDPLVEPVVEIFQGHRNSYEYFGAPRVGRTAAEAIAGMQPYGMVWNALALQYKLGFQASSDHISTHISYAIPIVEGHNRDAILDAFKKRHCYAATDNIVLDVRSGDHLMGDEFTANGPVKLRIMAHGTRPISRVDVIKDFVYVYSTEPKTPRVEFEWTDNERRPAGTSWYYVRIMQDDGELAWGSPMWVHVPNTQAGGE